MDSLIDTIEDCKHPLAYYGWMIHVNDISLQAITKFSTKKEFNRYSANIRDAIAAHFAGALVHALGSYNLHDRFIRISSHIDRSDEEIRDMRQKVLEYLQRIIEQERLPMQRKPEVQREQDALLASERLQSVIDTLEQGLFGVDDLPALERLAAFLRAPSATTWPSINHHLADAIHKRFCMCPETCKWNTEVVWTQDTHAMYLEMATKLSVLVNNPVTATGVVNLLSEQIPVNLLHCPKKGY